MLTYLFLALSIASLWIAHPVNKSKVVTLVLFLLSVGMGLALHQLEVYTLAVMALLFLVSYGYLKYPAYQILFGGVYLCVSVMLMFHVFPGFRNLLILDHYKIEPDTIPYSLYLNFDKALVGFVWLFFAKDLVSNSIQLRSILKPTLFVGVATILILLLGSYLAGYVRFSPKIPWFTAHFLLANLFFTCLAEEVLFRRMIQHHLKERFQNIRRGNWLAIGLASIIFGGMHYPGGITYIALATIAGVGYGWAYEKTGRIESSVAIHFTLNVVHLLLFSYPALASAF